MRRALYIHRDKSSGMYKYRREFPLALQPVIGRRWFISSMRTKDLKEANQKTSEAESRYNKAIRHALLSDKEQLKISYP